MEKNTVALYLMNDHATKLIALLVVMAIVIAIAGFYWVRWNPTSGRTILYGASRTEIACATIAILAILSYFAFGELDGYLLARDAPAQATAQFLHDHP